MARKGRKKPQPVNPDDLAPGIAAGLTQGASKEEALSEFKPSPSGVELVRHMREVETVTGTRIPTPKFVAAEDADSIWLDEPTGRVQKNATLTFQPEVIAAMRQGMICLRCLEPQSVAFPVVCESHEWSGCYYPIKDRQIMDMAVEFEGGKHLGPAKPITAYMEEQTLRREKREFEQKLADGKSRMRGLR